LTKRYFRTINKFQIKWNNDNKNYRKW
jgi:hypothetical protein